MKKTAQMVLMLLGIGALIISGCSLLGFMKSPDKIADWVTIPTEDTEFIFTYVNYLNGNEQNAGEETFTITDVEEGDGETYFIVEDEMGLELYYILDKNDNVFVASIDDNADDDDIIILSSPIEVGNDWEEYEDCDYELEIMNINATKTVDAGTYSDIIVVKTEHEDSLGEYDYEYWFSQSLGMSVYMRDEFIDTTGDIYVFETELKNID